MNPTLTPWLTGYIPASVFTLLALLFFSVIALPGIVNTGSVVGFVSCALCAAFFWCRKWTFPLIASLWSVPTGRVILSILALLLAAGTVFAATLSVLMARQANNAPSEGENHPVIVLGCKVNGDTPSRMLRYRLQAAQEYLEAHPDVICVVSGGQGYNETRTEAGVMKEWLVSHGIDADRIIAEDQSGNTDQNLAFSKKMLEDAGISCEKAVLVTDGYHQYRASLFAKKQGIKAYAHSAKTELHLLPTYWIREWFGLCKYFVFG